MLLVATLVLAVLVGITLGLLGGGGSILLVPILVYVAGQDAQTAIATSLLVVGVTSATGMLAHARAGRVRWRTGLTFGAAAMAGAYGGGRLAGHVPGTWLLVGFAAMAGVTAVAMLTGRPRRTVAPAPGRRTPVRRTLVQGVVVGAATGMVGACGGFLVVPALALLGGLPMATAVGTSLLVVAMKSGAGLVGYLDATTIDWRLATGVTLAAVAGSLVGGRLAGRVPEDALRHGFGWFVAGVAAFVLLRELGTPTLALATTPTGWSLLAAASGVVAVTVLRQRRRGRRAARADVLP